MIKRLFLFITLLISALPIAYANSNDQYAMVVFFRSDCPYCRQFAPKFKTFTQQKRLQTYVFSLDNQPLPEYPVTIPATPEISQLFFENPRNITVPATFLINVNSRKFVKVSIGDVSYAELEHSVNGILNDHAVVQALR